MRTGIACASGSAKGVFVHGVLDAFERAGFKVDSYAASSSSTIPAAFASIHELALLEGTEYWKKVGTRFIEANSDVSKAVKDGIKSILPMINEKLFAEEAPCFSIAVSAVVTEEAAQLTQGAGAKKLGQHLMLSIRKKDKSWAARNLVCRLFDTKAKGQSRLTPGNLEDALYATTRMLHAWKDAAWIDGEPYVDASYTCMCPAIELAQAGVETVIAISPESGPLYRDFFQSETLPTSFGSSSIYHIQPARNLTELGVDYLRATEEGFEAAFNLGKRMGTQFLEAFGKNRSV
jgi:predicted acylesterase/phospholipase RssA